jgi:hypothetical protein
LNPIYEIRLPELFSAVGLSDVPKLREFKFVKLALASEFVEKT